MLQLPRMDLFLTENRGWGVRAAAPIPRGAYIVEYAGAPMLLSVKSSVTSPQSHGQVYISRPGAASQTFVGLSMITCSFGTLVGRWAYVLDMKLCGVGLLR